MAIEIGNLIIPIAKGDKGDKGNTGEIISISLVLLSPSATAYAVNNGSTTQAQIELGIPKGLSVSTTNINASGELVFTFNDNSTVNVGKVVGRGISEVVITEDYDFVVTYTDGTSATVGNLETEILEAINTILEDYYTKDEIDAKGFITKEVNNLTNYTLKTNTGSSIELSINSSTYVMTLNLKNSAGTIISTGTIDLPLETMVVGATYDNTNKKIVLTLKNGSTIDVPVADLVSGLQSEITNANKLSADLVDDTNTTHKFVTVSNKTAWNAKYDKPSGGIPKTDLSNEVKASLDKANSAVQDISGKEDKSNKVTSVNSSSTDTEYPSAKLLYDKLQEKQAQIDTLTTENEQLWNDHPDILDNNVLPKGTDLTLEGTGDLPMKVGVKGNSTQVQYSGKNNLNANAESFTVSAGNVDYPIIGTVDLVANQLYYISYDVNNNSSTSTRNTPVIRISDNSSPAEYQSTATNYNTTAGRKVWQFTPSVTGNYRLTYWIQEANVDITVSKFMVSTSSDTNYEPYVGNSASPSPQYPQTINNVTGNTVVKAKSKNLFDNEWEVGSIDGTNGQNIVNNNLMRCKNYIPVEELTNYKFSTNNNLLSQIYVYEYKEDYSYNLTTNKGILLSDYLTTEVNTKYIKIRPANFTPDYNLNIQLEKGTTATPFVPFAENTATFPLAQGQKLMLGDTLEDDGVHHKRKQIILDGSVDENYYSYGSNQRFYMNVSDFTSPVITIIANILCNKLITVAKNDLVNTNYAISGSDENGHQILFRIDTSITTVEELKTWLSNNPITIEYELAEETIDLYTEEQQTAYNNLQKMQSYYDLTYVEGTSDNLQPILTAHAKKSLKVMQSEIDELKQAILNS